MQHLNSSLFEVASRHCLIISTWSNNCLGIYSLVNCRHTGKNAEKKTEGMVQCNIFSCSCVYTAFPRGGTLTTVMKESKTRFLVGNLGYFTEVMERQWGSLLTELNHPSCKFANSVLFPFHSSYALLMFYLNTTREMKKLKTRRNKNTKTWKTEWKQNLAIGKVLSGEFGTKIVAVGEFEL